MIGQSPVNVYYKIKILLFYLQTVITLCFIADYNIISKNKEEHNMPEFSNPFAGNNSDKILNERELVRAVRFSIAGEFEAIQLYEQLADSTDNKQVKTLLNEIAGDEKEHVGNLLRLLKLICPEEKQFYKDGWEETEEILKLKDEN